MRRKQLGEKIVLCPRRFIHTVIVRKLPATSLSVSINFVHHGFRERITAIKQTTKRRRRFFESRFTEKKHGLEMLDKRWRRHRKGCKLPFDSAPHCRNRLFRAFNSEKQNGV